MLTRRHATLLSAAALLTTTMGGARAALMDVGGPPGLRVAPSSPEALPTWRRFAVPAPKPDGRPILALMIDDMGVNRVQTQRALALPGPLTMSWLPYAHNLAEQVAEGSARGHETMLHMPMEPMGRLDPGPNALRTTLSPQQNLDYLQAALASMPTAVGLNQHEGSLASLSEPLMDLVMGQLAPRQMLFIDSLTVVGSVAIKRARAAGLPSLPRDTFIDNSSNPADIRHWIGQSEVIARRYGLCIAIAHPRHHTLDALEVALPDMIRRGVVLWPISAAIAAKGLVSV
jgi:polysaccharide deacetylase 2 family uncharacterized protein YibQ